MESIIFITFILSLIGICEFSPLTLTGAILFIVVGGSLFILSSFFLLKWMRVSQKT